MFGIYKDTLTWLLKFLYVINHSAIIPTVVAKSWTASTYL